MSKSQNTAIFVDYENVYITLKQQYTYEENAKLEIISKIRDLYQAEIIRTYRLFCDFSTINSLIGNLGLEAVELKHISSVDSANKHKNASDIAIAVDVMRTMSNDKQISRYVIASSDSDMMPIISELLANGKKVDVICFKSFSTSLDYRFRLEKLGVRVYEIESLLGIDEFKQMTKEFFQSHLEYFRNQIGSIYEEYKRDNPYRIPSTKNLHQGLEDFGYCHADISQIIKLAFQNNIIEKDQNITRDKVFYGFKMV